MLRVIRAASSALLALVSLLGTSAAWAVPAYTVQELFPLPGDYQARANVAPPLPARNVAGVLDGVERTAKKGLVCEARPPSQRSTP
jgi:hypothetical protein